MKGEKKKKPQTTAKPPQRLKSKLIWRYLVKKKTKTEPSRGTWNPQSILHKKFNILRKGSRHHRNPDLTNFFLWLRWRDHSFVAPQWEWRRKMFGSAVVKFSVGKKICAEHTPDLRFTYTCLNYFHLTLKCYGVRKEHATQIVNIKCKQK